MDILIRKATIKDLESVNKIAVQEQTLHVELRPDLYKHSDTVMTEQWLNQLLTDGIVLVGEHEKRVIAYATCYIKTINDPLMISKKMMFIKSVASDKTYIGLGIGTQMLNYIKMLALEENCDAIELQVDSKNNRAISFYEKMGMSEKSKTMELNL
ncbi:MAG: GNAT family N-acetyltransferase [Bacilli bacterium]|nr:GNAT family N-acetyltransferase [Bacilli bacterium]MDD4809462.1 GNAT family N-acetyltransferase [Bacilli bacterium]